MQEILLRIPPLCAVGPQSRCAGVCVCICMHVCVCVCVLEREDNPGNTST